MVPFFSVMTLTILLERLQLLQTASIREPDRARGSFLWQHAVIATMRFLTFPLARFWTSSTQNIASALTPHSNRQTSRSGEQINHHFFNQHRGGQHLPCGKCSRYTNLWVHQHRKTDVGQCGARLVAAP